MKNQQPIQMNSKRRILEQGQVIKGGIPNRVGAFISVYTKDGKHIANGQMIRWSKKPAMLYLERRYVDTKSFACRVTGLSEKYVIEIPLSLIGWVELEPGVEIEENGIFYFEGKIRTITRQKKTWNPNACVPLQWIQKGISILF